MKQMECFLLAIYGIRAHETITWSLILNVLQNIGGGGGSISLGKVELKIEQVTLIILQTCDT